MTSSPNKNRKKHIFEKNIARNETKSKPYKLYIHCKKTYELLGRLESSDESRLLHNSHLIRHYWTAWLKRINSEMGKGGLKLTTDSNSAA